jgi:hypothetical protein
MIKWFLRLFPWVREYDWFWDFRMWWDDYWFKQHMKKNERMIADYHRRFKPAPATADLTTMRIVGAGDITGPIDDLSVTVANIPTADSTTVSCDDDKRTI